MIRWIYTASKMLTLVNTIRPYQAGLNKKVKVKVK